MRRRTGYPYIVSILVGLLLWELITAQFSEVILSPPPSLLQHLWANIESLPLPALLFLSTGHAALELVLATAVAIPLGLPRAEARKPCSEGASLSASPRSGRPGLRRERYDYSRTAFRGGEPGGIRAEGPESVRRPGAERDPLLSGQRLAQWQFV